MGKLLRFLKGYEKESILGPLFKLLEATLELFVPLIVASLIDVGIGNRDLRYVIKMFVFLVLLGVVGLAFSLTAQFFAAKAAVGFVKKIKHALFKHMEELSYTEIDRLGTSAMVNRMTSDMNQVQSGMNMSLRLLLRSPFVVAGAFVMAWIIDSQAAKVFGLTIAGLTVIVYGIMLITIPLYRKVQQKSEQEFREERTNLLHFLLPHHEKLRRMIQHPFLKYPAIPIIHRQIPLRFHQAQTLFLHFGYHGAYSPQ